MVTSFTQFIWFQKYFSPFYTSAGELIKIETRLISSVEEDFVVFILNKVMFFTYAISIAFAYLKILDFCIKNSYKMQKKPKK